MAAEQADHVCLNLGNALVDQPYLVIELLLGGTELQELLPVCPGVLREIVHTPVGLIIRERVRIHNRGEFCVSVFDESIECRTNMVVISSAGRVRAGVEDVIFSTLCVGGCCCCRSRF